MSELMFPDRGCSSGPAGCFRTGRDSGFQVLDSSFRVRDSERRIFVAKFQGRSKSWKGEARPKPHKTPDLNYLEFLYMLNPTPSSLICMYIYICIYIYPKPSRDPKPCAQAKALESEPRTVQSSLPKGRLGNSFRRVEGLEDVGFIIRGLGV